MKTEEENMEQKICIYEETNFKNTELGEIPADWEVVKLGDIFEIKQGKQLSSKEPTLNKIKRPFLRTSNVLWGKVDTSKLDEMYFTVGEFESLKLEQGDVLVCEGGDIGRTAIYEGDLPECAYQNHIHRLRARSSTTWSKFFMYWMNFAIKLRHLYVSSGNVTTIPNLSSSRLKNFQVPLPPLEEQKAVAYVLSTVQEAREKTEKIIEATKELKKSLMKHLFTYGPVSLEEASRINLKETEIGEIPTDWEVVKLGDLQKKGCLRIKNGFAQGNWNDEGIGIPQIRPFNITEDGRINFESMKYVQFSEGIEDYALQPGDVIFNNTNSEELVGKTAYWNREGKFTLSNHMTLLRVEKNEILDPLFLASYLHKNWMDGFYLQVRRRYVNQASVTLNVLKELLIPLPPLPVQQRIAEILQTVDEKIQAEEKKKQALDNLFNSMLHMLMSGKLRVKFQTSEEGASN